MHTRALRNHSARRELLTEGINITYIRSFYVFLDQWLRRLLQSILHQSEGRGIISLIEKFRDQQ